MRNDLEMDQIPNIGQNIKTLRVHHKLSQSDIARILGTSDKAVSTWENGRRGPKLKTIETFAKQFDVPIDVMVNGNLEDYYNKPSSRSQSNIQEAQDYLLKLIDFQGDKSSLTYEDMLFLKKKSPNKYNKGGNLGSCPLLVSLQNHIDRNEKSEHIFYLNKMVRISLVWWKLQGSNL